MASMDSHGAIDISSDRSKTNEDDNGDHSENDKLEALVEVAQGNANSLTNDGEAWVAEPNDAATAATLDVVPSVTESAVAPAAAAAGGTTTTSTVTATKQQARQDAAAAAYSLGAWAVTECDSHITVEQRDAVRRSDYHRALDEMESGAKQNERGDGCSSGSACDRESFSNEGLGITQEGNDDLNETGLARAIAVQDSDDVARGDFPTALELDPDAKSASSLARNTVQWYAVLATSLVALVAVTGAVTWQLVSPFKHIPAALPDRATLGIREYVAHLLLTTFPMPSGGSARHSEDHVEQILNDPTNPYRQALDWIQNDDPLALTPDSTAFMQRFVVAYLYFSTSVLQPWDSGCSPATVNFLGEASSGSRDDGCTFEYTNVLDPFAKFRADAMRWLSAANECDWAGVLCDYFGHVVHLDFEGFNMTGTFPDSVASLPFLRFVSLSNNAGGVGVSALSTNLGLAGSLPTVLGDMKHLANVELAGNLFHGTIPPNWYRARSFQKISLGTNMLTGTISASVEKWKHLIGGLHLHQNMLTGTIPSTIGKLVSLRYLWLSNNALTGTIPTEIGGLRRVLELGLQRNKLTGPIPTQIGLMTSLLSLNLQENQLNGTIPMEVSNLPIRHFVLANNQFTGTLLPLLNSTTLNEINIENNQFSGTLPTELGRLKQMYEFRAAGNVFVGTVPRKICKLRSTTGICDVSGLLLELQLDCAVTLDINGIEVVPEISCPVGCCTRCCDANGENCQAMMNE